MPFLYDHASRPCHHSKCRTWMGVGHRYGSPPSCSWTFGVYMRVSCVVSSSYSSIAHTYAHRQFKVDNHTDSMQTQDAGRLKCRPVDDHIGWPRSKLLPLCPMAFHRICLRQSRRCNCLVERKNINPRSTSGNYCTVECACGSPKQDE